MMDLPSDMGFKWLEVNSPAGLAFFLCTYNHPMSPCNSFTYKNYFNDTQADISAEICLDFLLLVNW